MTTAGTAPAEALEALDGAPPRRDGRGLLPTVVRARNARIVRLLSPGMLSPFRFELRKAAEEFVRRAEGGVPAAYGAVYTPEDVIRTLEEAASRGDQAAWIATDDGWRLLGFLSVILGQSFLSGQPECMVALYYLWPRRMNLAISPVLNEVVDGWARQHGCERVVFTSRRDRPKAWGRLGFTEVGRVYARRLDGEPA